MTVGNCDVLARQKYLDNFLLKSATCKYTYLLNYCDQSVCDQTTDRETKLFRSKPRPMIPTINDKLCSYFCHCIFKERVKSK